MATKTTLTVINGTDNLFKLSLSADGELIDHRTLLGAELRTTRGVTIADSDVDSSDWDFTNAGYLLVKLGMVQATPSTYICRLIIKNADHTTGLVWDGTELTLIILP